MAKFPIKVNVACHCCKSFSKKCYLFRRCTFIFTRSGAARRIPFSGFCPMPLRVPTQMGGHALLALSSGTAEGRLEGFGHLPQRVFLIGVQAEYHHRAQPYMRRCALFALFRLKIITMIKYD